MRTLCYNKEVPEILKGAVSGVQREKTSESLCALLTGTKKLTGGDFT